ncbi:MAG: ABC transporter permease [Spirochaetaceae bacterium]
MADMDKPITNTKNKISEMLNSNRSKSKMINYIIVIIFVLLIVLAALSTEYFFTQRNIINLLRQVVTNGLISLGMLVVILNGGIDLSVGPVVALAGMVAVKAQTSMHWSIAIILALLVGVLCGCVNGFFISKFKLQPFIVTLATMGAIRGVVYIYSESPVQPIYPAFRALIGGGKLAGIPTPAIIMFAFFPILWFFLNKTTTGRAIIAIGGNEEAVWLAGLNVKKNKMIAYMISGFFAAAAGVVLASRLGIAQPNVGVGYELDAIAAVVIGGGMLGGGGGSVLGTFGGVFALGLINNLLNLFNVQSYYQQIIKGGIILTAVLVRNKEKQL